MCAGADGVPVIIIYSEIFNPGLVGLVAGNVKQAFYAPTIVFTDDPEQPDCIRGSGRSIPGFRMKAVLDEIQEETGLLVGYGGHDMACGVTIHRDDLDTFRNEMCVKAIDHLIPSDYCNNVMVDVDIHDDETVAFVADTLQELGPYGTDFEKPQVRIKNFTPLEIKFTGTDHQHVIFRGTNVDVICWNGAEEYVNKGSPKVITAIGELEVASFDGKCQIICNPELILAGSEE